MSPQNILIITYTYINDVIAVSDLSNVDVEDLKELEARADNQAKNIFFSQVLGK